MYSTFSNYYLRSSCKVTRPYLAALNGGRAGALICPQCSLATAEAVFNCRLLCPLTYDTYTSHLDTYMSAGNTPPIGQSSFDRRRETLDGVRSRISDFHPSSDGVVRVVETKISNGSHNGFCIRCVHCSIATKLT